LKVEAAKVGKPIGDYLTDVLTQHTGYRPPRGKAA